MASGTVTSERTFHQASPETTTIYAATDARDSFHEYLYSEYQIDVILKYEVFRSIVVRSAVV